MIRITSYNVCYTKLLRLDQHILDFVAESARVHEYRAAHRSGNAGVITSYSIHHTKFYEEPDHKYDVTGGLCENNDKFAIDRILPEISVGDFLVIHDTGAHGFAMGYNYNGKLRSAEVLLKEDGTTKLIRRAETPADYFSTFDFSDLFKEEKYKGISKILV